MRGESLRRCATDERLARVIGFWWGFAEGLFFFIVPDVYISAATLFSLRAGAVTWLSSILGSVVAVSAIYVIMAILGWQYLAFLEFVPGISANLIRRVTQSLTVDGLPYSPFLVMRGVPLKVYGAVAFSLGISFGSLLLWTLFARIVRIGPIFVSAAAVRLMFHRRIDKHAVGWLAALGLLWLAFYVFYFVSMARI